MAGDDGVTIPEVAGLVKSDAVFAGEVLRLANSAAMGVRYEVLNVMHAVTVLGMIRLRSLVLTVALRDSLPAVRGDDLVKRCWRHNFASALLAEWLAGACWQDKNDAYTAGLLHEVGQMALVSLYPARYRRILAQVGGPEDLRAAEREAFGMDHREAGRWIAEHWGMPASLTTVMGAPVDRALPAEATLPRLTAIACRLAANLGFCLVESEHSDSIELLQEWLPADAWESLRPGIEGSLQTVAFKINAFESEFLT